MTPENKELFRMNALLDSPREACALLIIEKGRERLVMCRNIALGDHHFELPAEDFCNAEERGEVVAVIHSHPRTSSDPSEVDLVSCERSGLPWYILDVKNNHWSRIVPSGYRAPLVGRSWAHGVLDCYSLIRDYYSEKLSIELPDFQRDYEWWHKGENLYTENIERVGFKTVSAKALQEHDVILMQVRSPVPNHAAIYVGENLILHQMQGRLSSRDVYGDFWQDQTVGFYRFKGLK